MRKKLLLLFALMLGGTLSYSQYVNTFPYNEDFESLSTCGTTCGNACVLTGSLWTNDLTDGGDWTVDRGGTGSGGTGPSVDHNPGTSTGNYLYTETSGSCSGGVTFNLVSPYFDFTNAPAPNAEFWYHMQGSTMGQMHFDVDTAQGQGLWINDYIPAWTDNVNLWQLQQVFMCELAGMDSIRFRIRGVSGSSFESDMAVDDVTVKAGTAIDVGVTSVDSLPGSGCGLGLETIWISVQNFGGVDLLPGATIPVSYTLGTTVVNETFTLTDTLFACGDMTIYDFTTQADFSAPGTYTVSSWTSLAGDTISANDSSMAMVTSIPTISSLPYFEDFEAGDGGWTSYGSNSSWQYGSFASSPAGLPPGCGSNGWETNLTGSYNNSENSFVQSPCFDFSSLTSDPVLRFLLSFETENNFDEGWIESSTDNGSTWNKVGTSGTGTNWYNDAGNQWWESGPFPWTITEQTLTGLAGQNQVLLRFAFSSDGSVTRRGFAFDDILVYDGNLVDAVASSVDAPVSQCGLTATETITGSFTNQGTDTLFTLPVCFSVDGAAFVCETINDTIVPGQTFSYTFTGTGDFSAVGNHMVTLSVTVPGDSFVCNDTNMVTVINVPVISNYPFQEDFESGTAGWTIEGGTTTWAFGTPAKSTIQGAASGVNAWVTGGLGTGSYMNNEDGYILSPCFDFTNLPAGSWAGMSFWWNAEFSWDGANLQATTDGGTTWNNVGNTGSPANWNWYNDNTIAGNPGGSQIGWSGRNSSSNGSGGWVFVKHPIDTTLAGQGQVRFRVSFGSDGSVTDDGVAFDDFTIGVPVQVDLGPDTTVCGGSFIGDMNPAFMAWDWNTGDDTQMIQLVNTTSISDTSDYIVTAFDTLGFCTSDTVNVITLPAPFEDVPDTTVCEGGIATLTVTSSGVDVLWSTGDTTASIVVPAGNYTVTLSQASVACTYTDNITVSEHAIANILDPGFYCMGSTVMLDAGLTDATYAWSTGDTTQMTSVSMAGSYSVAVMDTNGCMSGDTVTLVANPGTNLGVDTTICDGVPYTLDAGIAGGTYLWSTGDTTQTISVSSGGSYTVAVVDGDGCTSSDTVIVSTLAAPSAGFNFTVSGNGLTVDFSDISTGDVTSWAWDFGDGNTDTQQNPSHTYSTDTSVTVTLTVSGPCGTDVFTQTVAVTGLEDVFAGQVGIYPNPNNGKFKVSFEDFNAEQVRISIVNLVGQELIVRELDRVNGAHTEEFILDDLTKGVFFVRMNIDGQEMVRKMIVR